MLPIFRFTAAALFTGTLLASPSLRADTLSWNNVTYSPGASGATTNTNVGTTAGGNTVSVQFSAGSTPYFNNNNTGEPSPAVGAYNASTTPIYADGGTGRKALQIFADFDNSSSYLIANAAITVTISFSQPVTGLNFSFYDVDGTSGTGNFTDAITNISGTSLLGATVNPMTLTPTAGYNTVNGNGFLGGTTNAAQNTTNGNASVAFGSTAITQFTFTYTDGSAANPSTTVTHSTQQIIALGDLTFNTVPEPSTWALLGTAGVLGAWSLRRRVRRTA